MCAFKTTTTTTTTSNSNSSNSENNNSNKKGNNNDSKSIFHALPSRPSFPCLSLLGRLKTHTRTYSQQKQQRHKGDRAGGSGSVADGAPRGVPARSWPGRRRSSPGALVLHEPVSGGAHSGAPDRSSGTSQVTHRVETHPTLDPKPRTRKHFVHCQNFNSKFSRGTNNGNITAAVVVLLKSRTKQHRGCLA